jgi:hypothetical protein
MARRNIIGTVLSGAQTILGRLAQWFRVGQFGAVQPPETPAPGRERLRTTEEIVAAISSAGLQPTAAQGTRYSYSYICEWHDAETGDRIGSARVQVEASADTPRSTVYSRARRSFATRLPRCVRQWQEVGGSVTVTCFRVGGVLEIAPSEGG